MKQLTIFNDKSITMTTPSFKLNGYSTGKIFLPAMFSLVLFSCNKETDINSPAFHISESEKLTIPAAIDLPANIPHENTRVVTFYAEGVQKYKSQAKAGSNPVTFEWVFVAPQADLYDATNKKVGTHSAGPTWQLFGTADSIYGKAFSPAKSAPGSDPNSIDWLQLDLKKAPTGIFSDVSYIQRIATKGGKAPAILPTTAGETVDVKYTAVYRFTKKNP
jgi:hypothetical protein